MTDTLRDELITLTCELIGYPSTADRPDQLAAVVEYVAHYLQDIPGIFVHFSESHGKPALVATLHDTRSPALMLNGHLDVVAAQPEQFVPQIRDGRIYGRASQDMKGSVAVLMRLLKDLAALEARPDVGFQFVTDEEIGGEHGTRRLFADGWGCQTFIAAEPTNLDICNAHKGAMWIEARLPGTTAHGSRPWAGRNPVLDLHTGLERLLRRYPALDHEEWRTTVTPTAVQTGSGSPNQVPPELQLTLDVRHIPEEPHDVVLTAVQECFATAEIVTVRCAAPLATHADEPAIKRLADIIHQVRGQPPRFYREHFSTDARFYGSAGIPAVCCGPVGAGLHSAEEWVEIDSLLQLYEVLRRMSLA